MPELPEVETIKKQLQKYLVGHKVLSVGVKNRKILSEGEKMLAGAKVVAIRRFGKVTVIDFSNGYSLVSHIKLTGQFIYKGPRLSSSRTLSKKVSGGVPGVHTHVVISLDKGGALYYNDIRRFGWMKVVKTGLVKEIPFIKKLGPEPFAGLSKDLFCKVAGSTPRPIKVLLMDQEKISGVGNIYANDALWLAKIHPKRSSKTLSALEQKKLFDAVLEVLKKGMNYLGASELAYVTPDGGEGKYQEHTLVYSREGKDCRRKECSKRGVKIRKFFLGGRGTYFCPACQKEQFS